MSSRTFCMTVISIRCILQSMWLLHAAFLSIVFYFKQNSIATCLSFWLPKIKKERKKKIGKKKKKTKERKDCCKLICTEQGLTAIKKKIHMFKCFRWLFWGSEPNFLNIYWSKVMEEVT